MSWSTRFRIRQYVKNSVWLIPFAGGVVGAVCGVAEARLEHSVSAPEAWQYSPSTATTVLSAIIGAMAALTGFVVTVAVLVVQMAIGTFSARYMRLWYRDRMLKGVLAVLIATLTFSFALLREIEPNRVPSIGVSIAGLLVLTGLLFFMIFLNRSLHRMRPVTVAALVGRIARRTFERGSHRIEASGGEPPRPGEATPSPVRTARAGAIQAVDERGLLRWARDHDRVIYLKHAIGDFVPVGEELAEVWGPTGHADGDERSLGGLFALGDERTIEQDPAFAVRIMVDIALKALSAAINDPTTATQVLDHLTELLRLIGATRLEGHVRVVRDEDGAVRIVALGRRWEDYLSLACTEIREYGSRSIQVQRRLRAMLEGLRDSVRPEHREAVEAELERLDATVEQHFGGTVDADLAAVPDDQGIGGPPSALRGAAVSGPSHGVPPGAGDRNRSEQAAEDVDEERALP